MMVVCLGIWQLPESDASVYYGDVNGDGVLNAADTTMSRRYIASGKTPEGFKADNESFDADNADVNADGIINVDDVTMLRRRLAATNPEDVQFGLVRPSDPKLSDFPTGTKFVAITFDDGPNSNETIKVLDHLKTYDARATFFVNSMHFNEQTKPILRRYDTRGS